MCFFKKTFVAGALSALLAVPTTMGQLGLLLETPNTNVVEMSNPLVDPCGMVNRNRPVELKYIYDSTMIPRPHALDDTWAPEWEEFDIPEATPFGLSLAPFTPPQLSYGGIVPPEPKVWSRVDAVGYSLLTNERIVLARAQLEQRTGTKMQVRAGLFPRVALTGNVKNTASTLADNQGPISSLEVFPNSYQVGLEFRQLLFDGFNTFNSYRGSRFAEEASYWNWVSIIYKTAAEVQSAFDQVLMQQAIVHSWKEAVEMYSRIAHVTKKRQEAGEITHLDFMRADSELKNAEGRMASAYGDLANAQENLRRQLQLPYPNEQDEFMKLEGPLALQTFAFDLEDSLRRAGDTHPAIVSALLTTSSAYAQLSAAKGRYLPTIEASANYSYGSTQYRPIFVPTGPGTGSTVAFNNPQGWQFSVFGRWEIFDFFGREGNVISKKADLRNAEEQLAAARYSLTSQVRELFVQKAAFAAAVLAQESAVATGKKAVEEAKRQYEVGEVSIESVLDAQRRLQISGVDLAMTLYRHNATIYQLQYVVGMEPAADMPTLAL